jgi:hypothetical protein
LGLGFLLEMPPNQAPHSSRPSTSGKARPLRTGQFCGVRHSLPYGSPARLASSLGSAASLYTPVLSYGIRPCAAYQ